MQGAILIIGSLLWDSRDERQWWRNRRLRLDKKEYVHVPIEYGRRSSKRGNTFTMTLEPDAPNGKGVLVPCAAPTARIEDLLKEAEHLWQAEQLGAKTGRLGASWGCVGVQFREETHEWFGPWSQIFQKRTTAAVPPVDENGLLDIPWPLATSGESIEFDFLLATATQKEINRPTVEEIAEAWVGQTGGYERYFFENIRVGIRTHTDHLIWTCIEEKAPEWIDSSRHTEAINRLREEAYARLLNS